MDFSDIPVFGAMKKRLSWLNQRQEVLATNVANADTPGYTAKDLKPFEFKEMVRQQTAPVQMAATRTGHLAGTSTPRPGGAKEEEVRNPYETSSDGNAVVLEEQLMKVSQTQTSHSLVSELYKKHLGMIRIALGGR